jgi:SAM-dependent methyltransferase
MTHEQRQREHYDSISSDYEAHYADPWSLRYRRRFIDRYLCLGLDLHGKQVLDAMCGPGQLTQYLLEQWPTVNITGLDISQNTADAYAKANPRCVPKCASFLQNGFQPSTFDAVFIVGGLHHLQPCVDDAVNEAHRLLKPGGIFSFCEPHTGSCLDVIRRNWYEKDSLFERNEAAVNITGLRRRFADKFEFVREYYLGNIAYFLVYNSMVFRLPLSLKKWYSPPLLAAEWLLKPLHSRFLSAFGVCQWRKRTGTSSSPGTP